ncbi:hypothetical protein FPQ18DRAFT_390813 [Pyronema domesticum]|nr:hypothetical protein FPQ18DRAFT_390813 [Pyronema domesticum]
MEVVEIPSGIEEKYGDKHDDEKHEKEALRVTESESLWPSIFDDAAEPNSKKRMRTVIATANSFSATAELDVDGQETADNTAAIEPPAVKKRRPYKPRTTTPSTLPAADIQAGDDAAVPNSAVADAPETAPAPTPEPEPEPTPTPYPRLYVSGPLDHIGPQNPDYDVEPVPHGTRFPTQGASVKRQGKVKENVDVEARHGIRRWNTKKLKAASAPGVDAVTEESAVTAAAPVAPGYALTGIPRASGDFALVRIHRYYCSMDKTNV